MIVEQVDVEQACSTSRCCRTRYYTKKVGHVVVEDIGIGAGAGGEDGACEDAGEDAGAAVESGETSVEATREATDVIGSAPTDDSLEIGGESGENGETGETGGEITDETAVESAVDEGVEETGDASTSDGIATAATTAAAAATATATETTTIRATSTTIANEDIEADGVTLRMMRVAMREALSWKVSTQQAPSLRP